MDVLDHTSGRLPAAVVGAPRIRSGWGSWMCWLGVGKDRAVAFLQDAGASPPGTLAIGDNWNGRAMLEQAGWAW
jgi:hypothetical protein